MLVSGTQICKYSPAFRRIKGRVLFLSVIYGGRRTQEGETSCITLDALFAASEAHQPRARQYKLYKSG